MVLKWLRHRAPWTRGDKASQQGWGPGARQDWALSTQSVEHWDAVPGAQVEVLGPGLDLVARERCLTVAGLC